MTTKEDKPKKNKVSKGIEPISLKDPHAIKGPGKRKDEREIVEEHKETVGSQSCKRKLLTELKKIYTFTRKIHATHSTIEHKTNDESENCRVLHMQDLREVSGQLHGRLCIQLWHIIHDPHLKNLLHSYA